MKYLLVGVASVLFLFFTVPVCADDEVEHVIKYRQYLMASISSHYKSLKLLTSGKINQPKQWLAHARALKDTAEMVAGAFPEDSDFGETDAKEEIWNNKDDFNQKAQGLVKASHVMLNMILTEDLQKAKKQIDAIGLSCKACHKKYREK
jgi:cytochrome c556